MRRIVFVALLALALPASAYRVTDIAVEPSGDRTQVTITADGPISYEKFLLTDPMRVVLDLSGSVHALPAADFTVGRGGVAAVRTSQYVAPPDGVVRIIVDVSGELLNYSTDTEGNDLVLTLQTNPSGTPFTAWAASSSGVSRSFAGGEVAALSAPGETVMQSTYVSETQGITVSEPWAPTADGFPVEWTGTGGRRVTIDVVEADIRTVMRSISDVSGYNIVLPEGYEATITARLRNVGWRDALMAILNTQNLVATLEGSNVLRLANRADFYTEINTMATNRRDRQNLQDLQTEVFVIRYATADDIMEATSTVLSERGEVSVDTRTNSLVVTDIPARLDEIGRLLPILDSPTAQVMIEAKLVEIDASASSELGIDWAAGNLGRGDALTHIGGTGDLGVGDPTGSITFGTSLNLLDIEATLSFLEQDNRAHILSEPRIAIIDNMTGSVLSGKQVPLTLKDADGNTYIQLYDIGVSLEVTPHINADNNVTLELNPVVSELSGEGTAEQPIILTQEANTTLMIEDGATAVIGGIMRSKQSEVERRVPVLGYIPLLGRLLFTYTSNTTDSTELVIFVTPHIIRPY